MKNGLGCVWSEFWIFLMKMTSIYIYIHTHISIYASSIIIDPSTMGFLFRTQPPSVRCLQRPNVSNPGGAHGRSASGDKGFDLQLDDTWRTAKTSWVHLDAADGSLTGEELHDVTLPLSPSYIILILMLYPP